MLQEMTLDRPVLRSCYSGRGLTYGGDWKVKVSAVRRSDAKLNKALHFSLPPSLPSPPFVASVTEKGEERRGKEKRKD